MPTGLDYQPPLSLSHSTRIDEGPFPGYENSSECVPLRTKTTKPLLPESSTV